MPFVAIDRYAGRLGLQDGEEFDRFHALIKTMDAEWLMLQSKKKPRA